MEQFYLTHRWDPNNRSQSEPGSDVNEEANPYTSESQN